jgi:hypothetical protein
VASADTTDVNPSDVSEGNRLWYIVDPNNPSEREGPRLSNSIMMHKLATILLFDAMGVHKSVKL